MPVGFRLNIRYLAPGLVLALTLLAIPPRFAGEQRVWRTRRRAQRIWRVGTLALFAVLIVVSAGAIGAIDTGRIPGTAALALAVVALPLLLVFLFRRGLEPVPLAGIGLAALIALAVLGRIAQTHYLDERYSSTAPDYPKTEQPATELDQGLGSAYDWARAGARPAHRAVGDDGRPLPVRPLGRGLEQRRSPTSAGRGRVGPSTRSRECPEWIARPQRRGLRLRHHDADLPPG